MSEQRAPYATATATPVLHSDAPATLVVSKDMARFVHDVQRLRNEAKRGDVAGYAVVKLDDLSIGSIIAFEA